MIQRNTVSLGNSGWKEFLKTSPMLWWQQGVVNGEEIDEDGPACLKEIEMNNIGWGDMFAVDDYAACYPLSLSLPSLKVLHNSNTRVLERHASSNCFSVLWRISDGWTPSAVRNLIVMHCSMLTDTFCSLIPLVELRYKTEKAHNCLQGRGGKQLPPSKVSNMLDEVLHT